MLRRLFTVLAFGLLVLPVTAQIYRAEATESAQSNAVSAFPLRWLPPELVNPEIVYVSPDPSSGLIRLAPDRDYIIQMPNEPVLRNIVIEGGHNVVMIGGEIYIPWQGDNPSISSRTALKIYDATGIVHIEGVLLNGEDISEGIQIDAPQAIIQLQNIGIFNVRARDQVSFSDNHPDLIQTYGNVAELRIDRFTGSSDYQGLFFKADFNGPHGSIHISRTNIIGEPTARQLIWFQVQEGAAPVTLEDVWVDAPDGKPFGHAIWPASNGRYPTQAQISWNDRQLEVAQWPSEMTPSITGQVFEGIPPEGNFVNPEDIGIGYTPVGYIQP